MAEIQLSNIVKSYGKVRATNDVTLTIKDKEFMVLLGPSGCGKTTLLRAIAGLDSIDSGTVRIGGRDVSNVPPRNRSIAMVFQSYAVFPHLSVFENIAFGLRMKKMADAEVRRRVQDNAELLRIQDYLERFPAQLSGGQRQRVAVARALAMPSDVLLMDEPLSNLDALLRLDMRAELKKLLRDAGATTVYVTHDQVEALSLGDRIAVMKQGHILQCDVPLKVYDTPANSFVAGFIGNPPMNLLKTANLPAGFVAQMTEASGQKTDRSSSLLGIRAENIDVVSEASQGALAAEVLVVEPLGSHNLVTARTAGQLIKISTRPEVVPESGSTLWLRPMPDKVRWLHD